MQTVAPKTKIRFFYQAQLHKAAWAKQKRSLEYQGLFLFAHEVVEWAELGGVDQHLQGDVAWEQEDLFAIRPKTTQRSLLPLPFTIQ
jgi:hypothetical protein